MLKRIICLLLCSIFLISVSLQSAFADTGDGNMDGGGGGMGSGTGSNFWHEGEDGVRVTVIKASDKSVVSNPIDLSNYDESSVKLHFGKKSKLDYKNGSSLSISLTSYKASKPNSTMPRIISNGGNANISAIKHFFCTEGTLKQIANIIGANYDKLISGNYKLLIEPLAYFTFNGQKYAMTATEAALYDQKLSGGLRSKMVSLTHQNLPLSLFLETSDLGFPAYTGSTTKAQSDSTIISSLGLGIVKFKPDSEDDDSGGDPVSTTTNYRVNTDVITSVNLSAGSEINPDSPASVTFHIMGGSYTVNNIVIPEDESQLVWIKWHTPSTAQTINITVSSTKGSLSSTSISANIGSLDGKDPPDPQANDRNDSFSMPSLPSNTQQTSSSWGIWSAEWIPNWVWHEDWHWVSDSGSPTGGHWEDRGDWVDEGAWKYKFTSYHATLSSSMNLSPDDKVPSAEGKLMPSGYGVKIAVNSDMSTSASSSQYTVAQTAVTYFPEFAYNTYWRHLDLLTSGDSSSFAFKTNIYSTYNRPVHFTPIWFPDGKYTAYTYLEDVWTPAGMLSMNLNDYVTIKGSVYDDWHIGPKLIN